jgi:hypothetical protein
MSGIARSLKPTHAGRFTFSIHREGLSPGSDFEYFFGGPIARKKNTVFLGLQGVGGGLDKGFAVLCFAQYVVKCDVIFHLEMRLGNCCDSGS